MQHINFFPQLERAVEARFSARQLGLLLLALLLLWLLFYAWGMLRQSSLADDLIIVKAERDALVESVEALAARTKAEENNSELAAELIRLESAVKFRRQLVASVGSDEQQEQGFSVYLNGLARQQVRGLWFTEIILSQRGEQMDLMGFTQQPEFLPQYMQRLSAEPVFEGQQFKVLKMIRAEKYPNTMRFEVRTHDKASFNE